MRLSDRMYPGTSGEVQLDAGFFKATTHVSSSVKCLLSYRYSLQESQLSRRSWQGTVHACLYAGDI